MARKAVPTKVKAAKGSLNVSRVIKNEFEPIQLTSIPKPPEHFTEKSKRVWLKVAKELHNSGILYNIDIELLEQYCEAHDMYLVCIQELRDNGMTVSGAMGGVVAHPCASQMLGFQKVMLSIGANLGIGPANRTKIATPGKPESKLKQLLKSRPA